ncbi:MAG: 23S rRNA (uracil(1939)-C(5))-methyltransferase RlmD [Candidatus Caldatribacteriota bacterium]|nr:23S rRNA (uracil(1939)-C(5))-methyltransferase RlmD [Candidatus Caldatribacteriota bacterium]
MKKIPIKIEESYEVMINNFSHQGEGIGRVENFAIFIPGSIPKEKVKVKIKEIKNNFARGELEEVIHPSSHRVEPPCPVFSLCGGCRLQHINYKKQLKMKKEIVENALSRIGNQNIEVLPTIDMKIPWRYRNKGHFHLSREDGKVKLGFYQSKSHTLISVSQCLLFSDKINELVKYLEKILTLQKVIIYNYKTDRGNLRGIILRESTHTGEIMIIFVTREEKLGVDKIFLDNLTKAFPKTVSIYQNINKNTKMVILGKNFKLLKGKKNIEDRIGPYKFKISPASFFQVNISQTEALYKKILEYSSLRGEETVIDSYCGTGAISIYLAGKAKKVYGLELEKGAVKDAWTNLELNNLSNLKFFTGKAEKWLYKWIQSGEKAEIIIIDPPRRGCSREVLKNVIKIKPGQILYISCNPATLARDVKYLTQNGYGLEKVQPFDMFPQTSHIECLAHLKEIENWKS